MEEERRMKAWEGGNTWVEKGGEKGKGKRGKNMRKKREEYGRNGNGSRIKKKGGKEKVTEWKRE